jgi:hypothetical protein
VAIFTGSGVEAVAREVGAEAVSCEQDEHLVSGELEAEAMSELDVEAAANELDTVSYPRFIFASRQLNAGGSFNPYLMCR